MRTPPPFDLELVFERLGQGLIRVDGSRRVLTASDAAKRHFHPTVLRQDSELPEPWPDVSLADLVGRLLDPAERARHVQHVPVIVIDGHRSGDQTHRVTGFAPSDDSPVLLHTEDRTQLERRSRAEREFVANAAHELLTPLTGIATAAFALEAGAKAVPEDRDRFIAHIASQAHRLTRVARALLVLARAQSGQEPPRLESVPLRPLLEDAVATAHDDFDSKVTLDCSSRLVVFVDRDLAEQAFTNLVSNAARHARDASVKVSAGPIGGRHVDVEVCDTGYGIVAERLPHLGDRFYSGGGRDGGGFGLGVAIAAQAVELLGGTLTFDSRPGEGTRAHVRLPSGRLAAA